MCFSTNLGEFFDNISNINKVNMTMNGYVLLYRLEKAIDKNDKQYFKEIKEKKYIASQCLREGVSLNELEIKRRIEVDNISKLKKEKEEKLIARKKKIEEIEKPMKMEYNELANRYKQLSFIINDKRKKFPVNSAKIKNYMEYKKMIHIEEEIKKMEELEKLLLKRLEEK